jgi:hypothetical protein
MSATADRLNQAVLLADQLRCEIEQAEGFLDRASRADTDPLHRSPVSPAGCERRRSSAGEWLAKVDRIDQAATPTSDLTVDWSPTAPPPPWFLVGEAQAHIGALLEVIDALTGDGPHLENTIPTL